MSKISRKQAIQIGLKSALSLFAIAIITVILHEGAHYLAASILGIPIARFALFDPNYFGPAFYPASKEYTPGVIMVSYAGGLFTGITLLSTLIFWRNWFKESLYRWFLGLFLSTFGAWQIVNGILEGAFHQTYILNATKLFFSPMHSIMYASTFVGMIIYWLLIPRPKTVERKRERSQPSSSQT